MLQLALLNFSGVGTHKNLSAAYKWALIAAKYNNAGAKKFLKAMSKKFTPAQKAEGEKLAKEYEEKHNLK